MCQHIVKCVAVLPHGHGFEREAFLHETFFKIFAEQHFSTFHEVYGAVGAGFLVRHPVVGAVVEDHAILQHFHHGSTAMVCGCGHGLLCDLEFDIETACKEGGSCAEGEFGRNKRIFGGAVG